MTRRNASMLRATAGAVSRLQPHQLNLDRQIYIAMVLRRLAGIACVERPESHEFVEAAFDALARAEPTDTVQRVVRELRQLSPATLPVRQKLAERAAELERRWASALEAGG